MESRLQSLEPARERLVLTMNAPVLTSPAAAGRTYVTLQREVHDALRAQHPEWIQPNGDCPTCDSYESRLAELLSLSLAIERARAH